jgi:hypothetical protein
VSQDLLHLDLGPEQSGFDKVRGYPQYGGSFRVAELFHIAQQQHVAILPR